MNSIFAARIANKTKVTNANALWYHDKCVNNSI